MPTPNLTDLVIFNPILRNDPTTPPSDRQKLVDKEDWDEVSQVLFADGPGLKNRQGGVEWNVVLKQMGLAKGLMGFMSMVETGSFPEPEEDTFQIIHSKRRVTCIYQVEQDHCLVAVYALPPSLTPGKAPTAKHSRPTSEPRTATITDEQYKTSLARACDRYLVENGSLSASLSERGREEVEQSLARFWSGWIGGERPLRETLPGSMLSAQPGPELDSLTNTAWESFIGDKQEVEAILISPQGVLAQNGQIFDDQSLVDLVRWKLEQTLSPASASTAAGKASTEKGSGAQEGGAWKKLGISAWGPSIGLGSSDGAHGERSKEATKEAKWAGIGQWFGMGSSAGPSVGPRSDVVGDQPVERKVEGADRVDLASLHSALGSETGEDDGSEAGAEWTIEKVWMSKGLEQVVLAHAIRNGRAVAIALHSHEAPNMDALLSGLPSTQPLFHQVPRSAQFGEGNHDSEEEEVSYHNPLGLEIRQTKLAGRGVFAPRDLSAGTILEESPVLVLTQAEWQRGELNDGVLGGYAFNWSNGGMAVGLGIASMFNHSPKPNVNFIRRAPTSKTPDVSPAMVFMACRPIAKGEELFICYGQESKLWFSPDYGKTEEQAKGGYEDEMAESEMALLNGFDGLVEEEPVGEVEADEEMNLPTRATGNVPVEVAVQAPSEPAAEPVSEDLFGRLEIGEDEEDRVDEEKRARKSEKKTHQREKTAKYQQKKALGKAHEAGRAAQTAQTEVQLAPPLPASQAVQLEALSYQAALQRLDLAPAIAVSHEDVAAIETEEMGKDDFEGDFGFAGWRLVKRVPGLSEAGEPALDSTLQIWAADLPSQLIGKLSQYIRDRKLVDDELSHLRRIYKNQTAGTTLIALYLTSRKTKSEIYADLADFDAELSNLPLVEKIVPARAAHSMKEVEQLRSLWPVALRRQRPVLASDLPWSAHRKAWVMNGMRKVVELARQNVAEGELPVAVYAASPPLEAQLREPDAIPPTPDIRALGVDTRKAAGHSLRHATIGCVTEIAKLRTVSPFADIQATRNGAGYLLTSLSVFMSHEPCVMCVMALVHSRVKEVFYLSTAGGGRRGGGFGGSYPVHSHSGLNHQMDLFDCSALLSPSDINHIRIEEMVDL